MVNNSKKIEEINKKENKIKDELSQEIKKKHQAYTNIKSDKRDVEIIKLNDKINSHREKIQKEIINKHKILSK
ncbi:hypothetical protein [uncultured archaeal virus]|uniref:Uncharacterized protein n=1 Tax=uncultured archaeal virus TaxID=1960247 RepID=A0A8B0LS69_9VIRU|nr:hypothetical protein [uncultured archaeal virus]